MAHINGRIDFHGHKISWQSATKLDDPLPNRYREREFDLR
jgi:hypothetical protein